MHTFKSEYMNIKSLYFDKLCCFILPVSLSNIGRIENIILNDIVNNFHNRETNLTELY